jgi:carbon starvation protein
MNALLLAFLGLVLLGIGYKYYGRVIARVLGISPQQVTPAQAKKDGVDYIPAKHWTVLFGHHFASISGAGPILGPVIACCLWGWGGAILWLLLGAIFLGGVHDFSVLFISLRHNARSIGDISREVISPRVKLLFSSFLWLALILVIAVFAAAAGKTLAAQPQVVIPTFGIILVAFLVGIMLYRWGISQWLATLIGVLLLFGLIVLGYIFPIKLGEKAASVWTVFLLIYAFGASVLPVNILLQPRDYLSTFVLLLGMGFGYLGLIITRPQLQTPFFISWQTSEGSLWPMLCVIIACGAISGFHGLIASGTTSKQLSNERDAQKIGYGGMLTESALALLALLCVCAGLSWQGGPVGLNYPLLMKEKGWIATFGQGYAQITQPILGTFGLLIGITLLKTFILTTLDSATRITRYLTEELFGEAFKLKFLKNRYFATLVILLLALLLALGNWKALWPVFGASNQLVASLSLLTVSVFLILRKRQALITLIPALLILVTTLFALSYKFSLFLAEGKYLLSGISILLFILTLFMLRESARVVLKFKEVAKHGNS